MKIITLATTLFMATVANATLVFEWQGEIDHVFEYQVGAAPEGLALGNTVTGTLQFERSAYDSLMFIQGSYSGPRYTFTGSIFLEYRVGDHIWSFSGSNISLQYVNTIGPTTQLFNAHSTSNDFVFESFPNYAGSFNAYFFVRDESPSLAFWDEPDIEMAVFDVEQFTSGGGGVSTELLDSNGDFIGGYSFGFDVTNLTVTNVPESSTFGLLLGVTVLTMILRRKCR